MLGNVGGLQNTSSIPNKKRHSTLKRCHSQTKRAIEKVETDSESYANKLKFIFYVIFNRMNFQPTILLAASALFSLAAATSAASKIDCFCCRPILDQ